MSRTESARIVLEASGTSLVRWVANQDAVPVAGVRFLNEPSYNSAKFLVNDLDKVVHLYAAALSSVDVEKAEILSAVLHAELPSIWTAGWIKATDSIDFDLTVALAAKARDWFADLQASGQVTPSIGIRVLRPEPGGLEMDVEPVSLGYLMIAGLDQWASEQRDQLYSNRLAQIQATLGLRPAELARLLEVSREAVRRWFDGAPIAPERWSDIDRLERIVRRLVSYFKAESLPALIRRTIPGLNNKTPLELINAGREDDLFTVYDAIFDRRVTQ